MARAWECVPRATEAFAGHAVEEAGALIWRECVALLPETVAEAAEAVIYTLWRFTSASVAKLAQLVGVTEQAAEAAIERIRGYRIETLSWPPLLFRLEWRLFFQLRSLPARA